MPRQVYSSNGSMDNPDNHPQMTRLLVILRASLIQQAKGLEEQRRAILGEVGEITKMLGENGKADTVEIGERDSISGCVPAERD